MQAKMRKKEYFKTSGGYLFDLISLLIKLLTELLLNGFYNFSQSRLKFAYILVSDHAGRCHCHTRRVVVFIV